MPLTRAEWMADESKRLALAKLIENSPLKEAIEILVFENLPGRVHGIAANDAVARALLNDRREGFFEFYEQLIELTQPPREETGGAEPKPWEHRREKAPRRALK